MFTNLFMHLLTIIGMVVLVAIATVIIAFIASFTYVIVKHFARAAYVSTRPKTPTQADKEKALAALKRLSETMNQYSGTLSANIPEPSEEKKDEQHNESNT